MVGHVRLAYPCQSSCNYPIMNLVHLASLLLIALLTVLESSAQLPSAVGIPRDVDVNSKRIKNLANKIVDSEFSNFYPHLSCTYKLAHILKATEQIVAGSILTLKVKICPKKCVNDNIEKMPCKTCVIEVWGEKWLETSQTSKFICKATGGNALGRAGNR